MNGATMTFLSGELLERSLAATGRPIPPEHSVHGLAHLPRHVLDDIEAIYAKQKSTLCVFAYLHHVSDAGFVEVKAYLDRRGWIGFEE
jgi:hypothetical protein